MPHHVTEARKFAETFFKKPAGPVVLAEIELREQNQSLLTEQLRVLRLAKRAENRSSRVRTALDSR